MAPTKTLEQWRDEIEGLEYDVLIVKQELDWELQGEYDPFAVEELRVALRGAQARLDERRRRYRASLTVKARNRAGKG